MEPTRPTPPWSSATKSCGRRAFEALPARPASAGCGRLCQRARGRREELGDRSRSDLAFCNWASVKIELRRRWTACSLRCARSSCAATIRATAVSPPTTSPVIYELRGDQRKGLFYARVARDRTAQIEDPDPVWVAGNHNQIANFLVADSRFEEALKEYMLALEAGRTRRVPRSVYRQNAGYCHLMLGRPRLAFQHLYASLRAFRGSGRPRSWLSTTWISPTPTSRSADRGRRSPCRAGPRSGPERQRQAERSRTPSTCSARPGT